MGLSLQTNVDHAHPYIQCANIYLIKNIYKYLNIIHIYF